jgi:hypothetical protein
MATDVVAGVPTRMEAALWTADRQRLELMLEYFLVVRLPYVQVWGQVRVNP